MGQDRLPEDMTENIERIVRFEALRMANLFSNESPNQIAERAGVYFDFLMKGEK